MFRAFIDTPRPWASDLDDLGPKPLPAAQDAPRPGEVEKFARHFNALKIPDHRREISKLVWSVARSTAIG